MRSDRYIRWFNRCFKFLREYYDCSIEYPYDPENTTDTEDGIVIKFNKIDYEVFISNFIMSSLFSSDLRQSNYHSFKPVREYISIYLEEDLLKK